MATKPNKLPQWASEALSPEVLEPPTGKKTDGWALQEMPVRNWVNWLFKTIYEWLAYFKAEHERRIVISPPIVGGQNHVFQVSGEYLRVNVPMRDKMLLIHAVDRQNPDRHLTAMGYMPASGPLTQEHISIVHNASTISLDVQSGRLEFFTYQSEATQLIVVIDQLGGSNE